MLQFMLYTKHLQNYRSSFRSSRMSCSLTKGVLRNFAKFLGKHLCQILFFNKVAGLGTLFLSDFQFQPFCHNGVKFYVCTQFQSQIIELEPRSPLKKVIFQSNPYKIEVVITSLIEKLELPNFGHMTATIQYNLSRVIKFCWWRLARKL